MVLPEDQVQRLAAQSEGGNARVTVDLIRRVVVSPRGEEMPFAIEDIRRDALLEGLDDIGLTLKQEPPSPRSRPGTVPRGPWIWQPGV